MKRIAGTSGWTNMAAAGVADAGLFAGLLGAGWAWYDAQLAGFGLGLAVLALMAWGRTSREGGADARSGRTGPALLSALLALTLRGGLLATLERLGLGAAPVLVAGGLLAWPVLRHLVRVLGVRSASEGVVNDARVVRMAFLFATLSLTLRVLYLYPVELMHEEAYYWLYAWHLDYGYVDHPPLVAWMIWAGTSLAGHTELGVRLMAPVLWVGAAAFVFALTHRIFDRVTAWVAVALFALLPFFFFAGVVAFPDTPLIFAWAGSVYFLHRMLVDDAPHAWIGVGLFLGLGLLAKLTIVLLGLAALLFAAFHPRTRRLFLRWQPYAAILLALLLFTPVVIWNANHEWAAFARQTSDRLGAGFKFKLPILLLFVAVHLTPIGLAGGWRMVRTWWLARALPTSERDTPAYRSVLLALWLVLVPLSVMVFASFFRNTKFNWTAPMWIPVLPFAAAQMLGPHVDALRSLRRPNRHAVRFAIGLLVVFALGLYYLGVGVPGVPYLQGSAGVGWRGLGNTLEAEVDARQRPDGSRHYVVGMNGDTTPAWVAFYRRMAAGDAGGERAVAETIGRHVFDEHCGMFSRWFPITYLEADALLLVARESETLEKHYVLKRIERADPIVEVPCEKNGHPAGSWFLRWVYGYRGP